MCDCRPILIFQTWINTFFWAVDGWVLQMYNEIVEVLDILKELTSLGEFTLHFVSCHGLLRAFITLIAEQVDANVQQYDGRTSLTLAAEAGHVLEIKYLWNIYFGRY
jgi:hypothetical protein